VAGPAGLPPAYTKVTQLDMFRDEDLAYALRPGQAAYPSSSTFTPAPRTNSTSSPSTPPPPGAPSPTALFRLQTIGRVECRGYPTGHAC